MAYEGLEEKQRQLYRSTIAALLVLAVVLHAGMLTFEVRKSSRELRNVIFGQITNTVSLAAQTGDLISLQQNLESITTPLSATLPVEVKIWLQDEKKLIVSARSASFSDGLLSDQFSSNLMANPFGSVKVEVRVDISHLVLASIIKLMASLAVLVIGLILARGHFLRVSRTNLVPVDEFTSWLSRVTPEHIREGKVNPPSHVVDRRLQSLFLEINAVARQLARREVERSLGELATQTAHDIRSPLSALKILAARAEGMKEESRTLLVNAVTRIEAIATHLLEVYRAGSRSFQKAEGHTLSQALEPLLAEKVLQLSDRPSVRIVQSWASVGNHKIAMPLPELQRVVSNLINNASEAIKIEGSIEILATDVEGRLHLQIRDDGCGIKPEDLHRVGQRGFSSKPSGAGLGLSHAKRTMSDYGGELLVHSEAGAGTKITLVLPLPGGSQ